jgi:hypothetical protein
MIEQMESVSLADKLVETLRTQKDQGNYPLTLKQLGEATDPQAVEKLILKTAAQEPFSTTVIVAQKKNVNAPVALRDDLTALAASPLLLEFALEQVCTPEKPLWPVEKVAKKLDAELQPGFTEAVGQMIHHHRLPQTVGVHVSKKGPQLYLKRMPPPPPPRKPEEVIAERLLAKLESQGRPGAAEFPLTTTRLLELTELLATDKNTKKALSAPAFADRVVFAVKKNPESPLALRQDLEPLTASPKLLEFALGLVCSEEKPTVALDKVAAKLDRDLRGGFTETVGRLMDEQRLPESVGTLTLKAGPALFLKKWAPKVAPEMALAQKLVAILHERRSHGPDAYPLRLSQLLRHAGANPEADAERIKKALAKEPFSSHVVVAIKNHPDSPAALAEDLERLAMSPLLLETLLTMTRSEDNHAQPLPDLMKKLTPAVQRPFETGFQAAALPPSVGSVLHKGKRLLFLKTDVNRLEETPAPKLLPPPVPTRAPSQPNPIAAPAPSTRPSTTHAPATAIPFEEAFDAAYDQLEQRPGSENYVSLVELRKALPAVDRKTFDAKLLELQAAELYYLRQADGRFGFSPEEREAGIRTDDGALLLFVSRNEP